jgi:hypothetical protein
LVGDDFACVNGFAAAATDDEVALALPSDRGKTINFRFAAFAPELLDFQMNAFRCFHFYVID